MHLTEHERIIGIKSVGGSDYATHYNFEFLIADDLPKILLLKLHVNRKTVVNNQSRKIGNVPYGVFREIIKYIRY